MCACVPQLPFIFYNMLQYVLLLLTICSTNTVNIDLDQHGDNGANESTVQRWNITKLVACFLSEWKTNFLKGVVMTLFLHLPQRMSIQITKH